jgi:hypothetical protein
MLRMLLKLIVTQPQWLLTHAQNYAALASESLADAFRAWKLRMVLYAISFTCLVLGLVCGVMALLLWAALPTLNPTNSWLLLALPVLFLSSSVFIYWVSQRYPLAPLFEAIQEQIKLDMLGICHASQK